ncbi:MAG: hypothetical protein JSU72_16440 [Deltaproteobacteria bacterium]|nr:MAG: hypothetical protein JSU72_16440 [Deltaproteobacteria bacterium]
MKKTEIPEAARALNVSWIESVEKTLDELGNPSLVSQIMKAAGQKCAEAIFAGCEEILGRKPETVDELLEANNRRRLQKLNLDNRWEREGNRAHLILDECGCTLVKAGLARPNPVHCLCSAGLWENLFLRVCRGPVRVEIAKAVGFGDATCEFTVYFEE